MSNLVTRSVELIYQMDHDELNQVIEAIKLKRTHLARQASRSLMVGDTVSFDAKTRGVITGTVTKVNRKTVQVRCNRTQGLWKVTASMLTQVA